MTKEQLEALFQPDKDVLSEDFRTIIEYLALQTDLNATTNTANSANNSVSSLIERATNLEARVDAIELGKIFIHNMELMFTTPDEHNVYANFSLYSKDGLSLEEGSNKDIAFEILESHVKDNTLATGYAFRVDDDGLSNINWNISSITCSNDMLIVGAFNLKEEYQEEIAAIKSDEFSMRLIQKSVFQIL